MNHQEWQNWWLERASTYFTDKIWTFSQPKLIDRLQIQKKDFVLELGFGYGRELSNFCQLSDHVMGAELSQWSCDHVIQELIDRGLGGNLPDLFPYDGLNFPYYMKGMVNIIYSCFVIQHLSRNHASQLISNCLELLEDGGKILFEFFGDPAYYSGGDDVFSGVDAEGGMFNNAFTREELPGFIEACGGKVLWIETTPITRQWGNNWVCFSR